MDLWSKGLGRMVLSVRLSDRSALQTEADGAVIRGTMGEPVYWGYAVTLGDDDVLDFIALLEQPAAVGFAVTSRHRWRIVRSALSAAVVFAWAIATRVFLNALPHRRTATPSRAGAESEATIQENTRDAQHRS